MAAYLLGIDLDATKLEMAGDPSATAKHLARSVEKLGSKRDLLTIPW